LGNHIVSLLEGSRIRDQITPLLLKLCCDLFHRQRDNGAVDEYAGPTSFPALITAWVVWPLGADEQERRSAEQKELPVLRKLAQAMMGDSFTPRDLTETDAQLSSNRLRHHALWRITSAPVF